MPESSQAINEPSPGALRWVEAALGAGATIESVALLAGATSSVLHSIVVRRGQRTIELVLRRFVNEEWLKVEPDLARHEAASLKKAAEARVPTPELIAYDETGEQCGVPSTLMTRLPGAVELKPKNFERWFYEMAEAILSVHELEAADCQWSYYPYNDISKLEPPRWSTVPALWEQALEIVAGPRPEVRDCFIHRDYHPTNVLWQQERLSAIVDWVNACRGAAGFDLSWCRQNLVHLYGVESADRFLQAYQSLAGASFAYHPYWDLIALIELLPGPPGVYEGWPAFGFHHLNEEVVLERVDQYLVSVMARM
jgi:aminoglycoside phosphotransferase (APT) family kinase protein